MKGADETARRIRRNLLRYLVLTQAMVYRNISTSVQKRFPTMNHLVTAGIMSEAELKEFDSVKSPHIKYWVEFCFITRLSDKFFKWGQDLAFLAPIKNRHSSRVKK